MQRVVDQPSCQEIFCRLLSKIFEHVDQEVKKKGSRAVEILWKLFFFKNLLIIFKDITMFSCLSWGGVKVRSRQSGPGLKLSIKPSIKSSELVTTRSHVTNRFKWVPASSNRQIPTATVSPLRDGILSNTFQWGLFHHCRYSLMLVSYAINIQKGPLSLGKA